MPNIHLQNALRELKGAHGLPEISKIEIADNNSKWQGTFLHGKWQLTKHHDDSYTTHTEINE